MRKGNLTPERFYLHQGWQFKTASPERLPEDIKIPIDWLPATVPGTVHTDLYQSKFIPDPFYADNEKQLGWIHESDWVYRLEFNLPEDFKLDQPIFLVFEGLDTIANIFLNGNRLGSAENMFRRYRFTVQNLLEEHNLLEIHFISPVRFGRKQEEIFGKLPVALNSERAYLRKAQYSFGWDWGPSFPTVGIWRPVYLWQPQPMWIENVRFHNAQISPDKAQVMVEVDLGGQIESGVKLQIHLFDQEQSFKREAKIQDKPSLQIELEVLQPRLWWPNGEGEPHLYKLEICLLDNEKNLYDCFERKVGIRNIQLQTRENGEEIFRLVVNGRPIFARGANWIPADMFIPRLSPETYRKWLTLAKEANMNILRVWGGGIYEEDIFYQLCDELGLLVWQDFMFACGAYPEHPAFLENITAEFQENVNRLQHHPCIALWCGNNENEWIWHQEQGRNINEMPGYKIFHELLPDILRKIDPLRPYWPSSPFGRDEDPNDPRSGNRHQWNIWSYWQDYTTVVSDESLFVTEFGFQAPANRQTLESVIPEKHRYPQSRISEWHNKQVEGNERLFRFLAGHLPVVAEWKNFIYLTQLNQALALKTCVEHWRSRWPKCAGSIIWQLNDCWPVSSWSLIDSNLLPKIAYYFVKKAFAQYLIVAKSLTDGPHWIVLNNSQKTFQGEVEYCIIEIPKGKVLKKHIEPIELPSGQKKDLGKVCIERNLPGDKQILFVSLRDTNGNLIYRNWYGEYPWKYLQISDPVICLKWDEKQEQLLVSAKRLALFVDLYHPYFQFSDRGFILLPGEQMTLKVEKMQEGEFRLNEIEIYYLNQYLPVRIGE